MSSLKSRLMLVAVFLVPVMWPGAGTVTAHASYWQREKPPERTKEREKPPPRPERRDPPRDDRRDNRRPPSL